MVLEKIFFDWPTQTRTAYGNFVQAKRFQGIFLEIDQPETRIAYDSHVS